MPITSVVDTRQAVKYGLVIEQGTDLELPINQVDGDGLPINMAGYTAKLQVRQYVGADDVLFEMSTENGKIDVATGTLVLNFVQADFADTEWFFGVYDLEIESTTGKRTRIMQGSFEIDREVTQ